MTSVSGRGVGMDVVRSNIEKIGGTVDVVSRPGEGSTIRLKIPLTLAIIPGLVVTGGNCRSAPRSGAGLGEVFVIPQVSLVELIRLEDQGANPQIENIHGTPVYRRRGSLLPIAYLREVLELEPVGQGSVVNIVVLQAEDRQFGLVVDGISDTQEIVVKPLGKQLKGVNVYAGATIMGDGRVALILDVLGISQRSGVLAESREQTRATAVRKEQVEAGPQRLLLFRAGSFERLAIPLALVARLEEFARGSIEHAGGCQVVQYRERILPLIPLREVLDGAAETASPAEAPGPEQASDPVQVIVFNDGDRMVGLMVEQILDVTQEPVLARQKSSRRGLLGSGVVGKRVADFLDLDYVLRSAAEGWFQAKSGNGAGKTVLIAEGSPFSRGLLRSGLDMEGYRVMEAATSDQAIRELEQQAVDIVVASLDLPLEGGSALLNSMRRRPEWEAIPVLALAESVEQVEARAGRRTGEGPGQGAEFQDCQLKFDRKAMLESVARLASTLNGLNGAHGETGRPAETGRSDKR